MELVEQLKPIFVRPIDRYTVGLDLGQSVDSTAISVLHHTRRALFDQPFIDDMAKGTTTQPSEERYHIVHLERLPLGMPYPAQIAHVQQLMSREPLASQKAKLVLDDTGAGRPCGDLFFAAGLKAERVTITSGLETTQHGGNGWHVPKGVLISTLESRMHSKQLKIAAALSEAGPLREELLDFERHVTESGRLTYSARASAHDDIILSISLALWYSVRMGVQSDGRIEPFPF
jgi:hypothetical protein